MSPRMPSGVSYPTDNSIRYFYAGVSRVRQYPQLDVDACIERMRDEDPSIDDGAIARIQLRQQALLWLAMQELERIPQDDDSLADAANASIFCPVHSRVCVFQGKRTGVVVKTYVDVGVRVYDVLTDDGDLLEGLLLVKDIARL